MFLRMVSEFEHRFYFKVSDPQGWIFSRVISDISIVLRETILTVSSFIETGSSLESDIVRVVSLGKMEVTEIARYRKPILWVGIP